MTDYTKATNFTSKDSLSTGNPLKIVKGTEIDTEFNNIQTAIATKTDNATAAITGGSITGVTISSITDLAVTDGGTGASDATTARSNLSAAKSGANSDITSITGLTTALAISQGGTGSTTLTANNVLLGNGTSALQVVAPGTSGNVLTSNGTIWQSSTPASAPVSSVNGVTGAVVTTNLNAIGSVILATSTTSAVVAYNSTISGTYLLSPSNGSGNSSAGSFTPLSANSFAYQGANLVNSTSGNFDSPYCYLTRVGTGTWRCLNFVRGAIWNNCCGSNTTVLSGPAVLFVRVS